MPYEPDKQQQGQELLLQQQQQHAFEQEELELMQQQQELGELQHQQHQQHQHQPQRRDSCGEERLPANPSLSSWQTAAAQGGRASRGGVSVGGSRLGQQGSGSRIEALLEDFEQGVTPSLLDLAEL